MELLLTEYNIAWAVYLLGFLVVYRFWARIVWWLPLRILRQFLKGLLALVLLTPVASERAAEWLVPAWLNFSYAVLLGQQAVMGRTLFVYSLAGAAMLAVLALDAWWARYRRRKT
ncbi:hypothetical protein [Salicola sp. Rm-C-2C1-2]|uniref:hypothetical protein n=1 Tax=Salicola sp. Rm-C-2C1-2 TaxID=3141321 RepID=UPI0032E3CD5D